MVSKLARSFAARHPQEAALLLETAEPTALGAFFSALGAGEAGDLVQCMSPHAAAACLTELPPETAAAIVELLPEGVASNVLAQLGAAERRAVMAATAPEVSRAIRSLLRYPDGTVGTEMVPDPVTLRRDMSLVEATAVCRRNPKKLLPVIFILDQDQSPVALVDVRDLLVASPGSNFRALHRACPSRLRAMTRLETVFAEPAWATNDYLPVVDADKHFVGVLGKSVVMAAMLRAAVEERGEGSVTEAALALADMIWEPAAALFARAVTPPGPQEQAHGR